MATILENLRNLSQKNKDRIEEATSIAEKMKKVAEAAKTAGQVKESGKE